MIPEGRELCGLRPVALIPTASWKPLTALRCNRPSRVRASLIASLVLALGLLNPVRGSAQSIPGSREDLVERARVARDCYDLIDYRCVIDTLEGPLLVREELPSELPLQALVESFELLGMSYLMVGLDAEAERCFERLLDLDASYRLRRADASPEQIQFVQNVVDFERTSEIANVLAQRIRVRAAVCVAIPQSRASALRVVAALLALDVARSVIHHVIGAIPTIDSPPWGPLDGPTFALGGLWRALFGSDTEVWGPGLGLQAEVGLRYRPFFARLRGTWSRHASTLEHPITLPTPALDVLGVGLFLGGGDKWERFSWGVGMELGGQYLSVTDRLRTLNPTVGLGGEVGLEVGAGFSVGVDFSAALTFGTSSTAATHSTAVSTTTTTVFSVGYAP